MIFQSKDDIWKLLWFLMSSKGRKEKLQVEAKTFFDVVLFGPPPPPLQSSLSLCVSTPCTAGTCSLPGRGGPNSYDSKIACHSSLYLFHCLGCWWHSLFAPVESAPASNLCVSYCSLYLSQIKVITRAITTYWITLDRNLSTFKPKD